MRHAAYSARLSAAVTRARRDRPVASSVSSATVHLSHGSQPLRQKPHHRAKAAFPCQESSMRRDRPGRFAMQREPDSQLHPVTTQRASLLPRRTCRSEHPRRGGHSHDQQRHRGPSMYCFPRPSQFGADAFAKDSEQIVRCSPRYQLR